MYLSYHVDMREMAGAFGRLAEKLTQSEFWKTQVEPHPIRAIAVLAGTVAAFLFILSMRNRHVRKLVGSNKKVQAALHATAYYKNKLKAPDAYLETRDRKQFRKCEPLEDGLVSATSLEQIAWNWCYCRYVAGMIRRDAEAAEKAAAREKRPVRREIRRAFQSAEAAVPDLCRIWVDYIDKKGRRRDRYRFTYRIDEIMAAVPEPVRKAAELLERQGFKCAKCGKDPDDGVLFELSPDGKEAWCDECSVGNMAKDAIRAAMAQAAEKRDAAGT